MKANELRIGSWFNLGALDNQIQATCHDIRNLVYDELNGRDTSIYQPIPLTEKLLLEFGFNKTDDYGDQVYYEKGNYYVCYDHEDWVFGHVVGGECTCLIYNQAHFQYAHQLQTIYFALTGEELTRK